MARITDFIKASQWSVKTEEAIKSMSLAQLRGFILDNAEVEEDEGEESHLMVDGRFIWGKTYEMTAEGFWHDEFFISDDGRVFYLISLNRRVEIVDEEEHVEVIDGRNPHKVPERKQMRANLFDHDEEWEYGDRKIFCIEMDGKYVACVKTSANRIIMCAEYKTKRGFDIWREPYSR